MPGGLAPALRGLTKPQKAKLSSWILENQNEDDPPSLSIDLAKSIIRRPVLSIGTRRDRALLYLARRSVRPGVKLQFAGLISEDVTENVKGLELHTESIDQSEAFAFLNFLVEMKFVNKENWSYSLTMDGWLAAEAREAAEKTSSQAFVAMWFSSELDDLWINGIKPAVLEMGYNPMRIDAKEHLNKIDDEIISEIRKSKFLIADFTSELDKPRGGVYFEAGFAFGLNIPVVWMCRLDLINNVHFDTRQYNHITWETSEEAKRKLKNRIGANIGLGPLSPITAK